jgi:hypothetical protein
MVLVHERDVVSAAHVPGRAGGPRVLGGVVRVVLPAGAADGKTNERADGRDGRRGGVCVRLFLTYFAVMTSVGLTNRTADVWRSPGLADHVALSLRNLPLGDPARRGLVRAMALVAIQMWCLAVVIGVSPWFAREDESPAEFWGYLSLGAIVVALGVAVVQVSVILFNRPRNVVAPHMRAERGLLR